VGGVHRHEQGRGETLTGEASATVMGSSYLIGYEFKFKTISNQVQIISNFDWPKQYFPWLDFFK
jgi:hypothetical protein